MPGIARQFEPQITRTGGAPSKYRFTTRCSGCTKTDSYEASKPASDEFVKGYFKDRGWLLGRDRAYDLCPACLAKPWAAQQPRSVDEARHQRSPEAANPSSRLAAPADKRSQDTADILARHLGKPEALAAEVFRPKQMQSPRPSAPHAPQQTGSTPAPSPEVEQALTGMAADLKSLRATMEHMAEQVSRLVALGGQQIEAIARLAPLMVHSAEGISGSVREVVTVVRTLSQPAAMPPAQEPVSTGGVHNEPQQDASSEPEPVQAPETPAKRSRRSAKPEGPARKAFSAHVVVKSIPDAKRPDRFYTSIRLPRELWDRAGFGPEDRIQIDWKKKALSIIRVLDGGVKPKAIGDAVVVLQSWRLGDINFDSVKVASGHGILRLTSP
ncbi:hypothetical protein [Microvirga mediterraneensis]|uniref:Uncharacterized protein n=1 Tax=Microvirga mediterraneensis TaxID=2754695 RepID=A0A838BWJ5_9HYPH|nr:hypothetical protein [Microvirga mediterraneensis]MBA1159235.1 hypothetical protein [Microvirga mediterraneensis]